MHMKIFKLFSLRNYLYLTRFTYRGVYKDINSHFLIFDLPYKMSQNQSLVIFNFNFKKNSRFWKSSTSERTVPLSDALQISNSLVTAFLVDFSSSFHDSPKWFSISPASRPDGKQTIVEMRNSKKGLAMIRIRCLNTTNTVQIENFINRELFKILPLRKETNVTKIIF